MSWCSWISMVFAGVGLVWSATQVVRFRNWRFALVGLLCVLVLVRNVSAGGQLIGDWLSLAASATVLFLNRTINRMFSDLRRTNRALTASEQVYRAIFQTSGSAMMLIEDDTSISQCNAEFENLSGYSREEIEGRKSWTEFFAPEMLQTMLAYHRARRGAESHAPRCYPSKFVRKSGETLSVLMTVSLIPGTMRGVASMLPVEEYERAQRELQRSLALLNGTLDSTVDGLLVVNSEGRVELYNQQFMDLWGITPEQMRARDDQALLRQITSQLLDPEAFLSRVRAIYKDPQMIVADTVEFRDSRVYERYSRPLSIGGQWVGRVWSFHDVTDHRRADEALKDAEAKYRGIFENAVEGIFQTTPGGQYLSVNPALARIYGYERPDELMTAVHDITHQIYVDPGRRAEFARRIERDGLVKNFQSRVYRRDGSIIWISENARTVLGPDGELLCYEGFIEDISEMRRAESDLIESNRRLEQAVAELKAAQSKMIEQERLRALGQMASGIAHDFNNTLSPILGFSEMLLARPDALNNREKLLRYLTLIHTAAKDAANLVQRMREFYRQREARDVFVATDLNQVVRQSVQLTQPKWKDQALGNGASIEIVTELDELPPVAGIEADLREVLTNLIFNAVDAMPQGGTLTLSTRRLGDLMAELQVRDTGNGMSDKVRERCMEPFFTTKGSMGTGLGLSSAWGVIQRHDGRMRIDSVQGQGTTISVQLPIHQAMAAPDVIQGEPGPSRPLHVLVLDDDAKVREVVIEYLKGDGCTVEIASNGREGIELFRRGKFDLVLSDHGMPEMPGDQVALAIKQLDSKVPVILLTGFGDLINAAGDPPEGVDLVLGKPVTLHDLRRALAKI